MIMATSCYCCTPHKGNQHTSADTKSHMDLDGALQELGMLSSITESRKQYLHEKLRKDKAATSQKSSPGLCVVQMNSNYVTNFSFSGKSSNNSFLEYLEDNTVESKDTDLLVMASHLDSLTLQGPSSQLPVHKSSKMRSSRNRLHFYKPYDFPWRPKLEESLRTLQENSSTNSENESGTTQIAISRQDSGNKSNPGSPVKCQKGANNAGCSIIRSRSLDDLDITKLEVKDGCSNEAGRAEIETVSQRISNLHVS